MSNELENGHAPENAPSPSESESDGWGKLLLVVTSVQLLIVGPPFCQDPGSSDPIQSEVEALRRINELDVYSKSTSPTPIRTDGEYRPLRIRVGNPPNGDSTQVLENLLSESPPRGDQTPIRHPQIHSDDTLDLDLILNGAQAIPTGSIGRMPKTPCFDNSNSTNVDPLDGGGPVRFIPSPGEQE